MAVHWRAALEVAAKLPVTPMLVLVDAEGSVRAVWRGKLGSAAEEAAVLARVRRADGEE
jgi:hypothetical protein